MEENFPNQPNSQDGPKIMRVQKRDGSLEPVDINKIVNVVMACAIGLKEVEPMKVATKAISGLYDGASTADLDRTCIQTASFLISEDPEYSQLASRLLARYVDEEVTSQSIHNFYQSIKTSYEAGLISEESFKFVKTHKEALNVIVNKRRTHYFEYFGLKTLYDRYLYKDPTTRKVTETPQFFFLRVACGLAKTFEEASEFYELISKLDYLPSSPTLFNSGSKRTQLSSCYLLDSPEDSLKEIYNKYKDVALLSKFAGGIGLSFSKVRSRGSLIKGTNGFSNGVVPWLKTLDSSVVAVNQGGRRKGAACVYLETWHADIEEFLQLRDNTGDEYQRTHNLNLSNWIPDLFMKRVEQDEAWSLFNPNDIPELVDSYGKIFEEIYLEGEKNKKFVKQIPARTLYSRMIKTLAQTGNGWMTFKDASNKKCNQILSSSESSRQAMAKAPTVHLSNLCTEIIEVTSNSEVAVCNLGSVNLAQHVVNGKFDFDKLKATVSVAMKYLDRVIDINFYPIKVAENSNKKWRPVGLGIMGLQDAFFKLGYDFDSEQALKLSNKISEMIYFTALETSCLLAEKLGAHPGFKETKAFEGILQFDSWGVTPEDSKMWNNLKQKIKTHGLRNSLMIAIAPTATIATLAGVYEATEPQLANFFKRETLSGEFLQVNKYLVQELKKKALWTEKIKNQIKLNEGSVQEITEIPSDLKRRFRTVWELPQKILIDLAAGRGAFIDQSQSLNLFIESPSVGILSSMYMYAWKQGLKTTYYLRSRPATKIKKTTASSSDSTNKKTYTDEEALLCSLENPEICEACQ
ncbi:MAG: ribonucleoside-diphosphate reductase subunit alpha [Bdellovibrionaceae bacterium]|nr:ribonucleoside-diphosphate reductase subunit alpha [Pseudobdellovibrionaceae bacterium]